METFNIDCLIVGGGVAGLAIAQRLSKSKREIILIEKENLLAQETSSRNSEVIHAGIYYKQGSLKSDLCIRGKELIYQYLDVHKIPFIKCGKFILATTEEEEKKLYEIYENGLQCGVKDLVIDHGDIRQYDFLNCKTSVFSPSTGIFDSHSYIDSLKREFEDNKGILLLGNELKSIDYVRGSFEVLVKDNNNSSEYLLRTREIVNCAGLQAHKIVNEIKEGEPYQANYKKGEYYNYSGKEILNHLIYPIPSEFSLGIHATIDLGRGIRFGPSSYNISSLDYEVSLSERKKFYTSIRNYWPSLNIQDLVPSYSGIRPLIAGYDDFLIDQYIKDESIFLSILGYASPGLTSSLALAEKVSNQINEF